MSNSEDSKQPDSTLARSFSASLNDAFNIESDLGNLSQTVEQKKKEVTSQSQELEAIEARLRKTEEELRRKQSATNRATSSRTNSDRRVPLNAAFDPPPEDNTQNTHPPNDDTTSRGLNPDQGRQGLPLGDQGDAPSTPSGMPGSLPS
ncbi:MAG: hypothetical protein M1837_002569 [Sclerophora amabilis]|nr:MAG: hypothetical protein M1837_002569 [Sclerophora amabilis]